MTVNLFAIVEGHGEQESVPILVRRIGLELFDGVYINCLPPYRLPRGRMAIQPHLSKAVALGVLKLQEAGGGTILILFDADDDDPALINNDVLTIAQQSSGAYQVSVVVAVREFESWFLAAANSLRGKRRIRQDAVSPSDPESIRDAKGYLGNSLMESNARYAPTVDQPALTNEFSLEEAKLRCQSFRNLIEALHKSCRLQNV